MTYISSLCEETSLASKDLYSAPIEKRNKFLFDLASRLEANEKQIITHNEKDLEQAKIDNLSSALIDRLTFSPERIKGMAKGVLEVAALADPLGVMNEGKVLGNGITLYQQSVPLGVVLVIYESRPNVTIDIVSLAVKSGNAVVLRGGKEALNSNLFLGELIKQSLEATGFDKNIANVIAKTDRELVDELLQQTEYIDIVVPRGGPELIRRVSEKSSIPVIKHDKGLCHVFLDDSYEKEEAIKIILNAKVQRPGVCNALETLLIHENVSYKKELLAALQKEGVEIRLDEELYRVFPEHHLANDDDWNAEYLDLILSIKQVKSVNEAVAWINRYGSKHTEAILTNHIPNADFFKKEVDSACIFVNCSTRFHDGGMFGLGAEVGISTQKLHVRGPMGIKHLTCLKYIGEGQGQVRT